MVVVLELAVMAYLNGFPMRPEHIAAMRAYLRQWIGSPIWDQNPHLIAQDRILLDQLRADIDGLTTREAIAKWLDAAVGEGWIIRCRKPGSEGR